MTMRLPLIRLYEDEACIDGFAGGGGASTGIEWALGRSPDIAINHDKEALAMHEANHPTTRHIRSNIRTVNYRKELRGKRCRFAWFSPDCTYHSKARGGKPFRDRNRARRVRGLAWEMVRCVVEIGSENLDMLFMENVEEFQDWCPLGKDGRPDASKKGASFRRWVARLRNLGGVVEWRELVADRHGAPTRRKRLFVIVRFDGKPIVWPEETHGPKRDLPYRTAAECLDFSLPVPSIFLTPAQAKKWGKAHGVASPKRPLATATLRRIARGIQRFVIDAKEPFIIPAVLVQNHEQRREAVHSVGEPIRTITAAGGRCFQLVVPTLINTRNGERHGVHGEQAPRVLDIQQPLNTITAQGSQGALVATFLQKYHAAKSDGGERGQMLDEPIRTLDTSNRFGLVAAFLAKHNGGHEATGQSLKRPVDTVVCRENKALVTSTIVKLKGDVDTHPQTAQDVREPAPTICANGTHIAEVRAFLVKYDGTKRDGRPVNTPIDTLTTKERFGLVTVTIAGEEYAIVDIGMRMLTPRELFRCQGFPSTYEIENVLIDTPLGVSMPVKLSKKAQTRMVGNSVPPHLAAALLAANLARASEAKAS